MKFVHTSDLLIGEAFPLPGYPADNLREARLQVVREIVALAEHEQAQALVLAGNSLADNRIAAAMVEDFAEILASSSIPVLLLPGLRDPYTVDSPYSTRPELFKDPIRLLVDRRPVTLDGVDFHPFPVLTRDQWQEFAPPTTSGGVGLFCHSPDGFEPLPFRYQALGGTTRPHTVDTAQWPGAPEATRPGEVKGSVKLVQLTDEEIQIEERPTGHRIWLDQQWEFEGQESLKQRIDDLDEAHSTLLELRLSGQFPLGDLAAFEEWKSEVGPRFLHLNLQPPPELIMGEGDSYAHPLLKSVVEKLILRTRLEGSPPQPDPTFPDDYECARWALAYLQRTLEKSPMEDLV